MKLEIFCPVCAEAGIRRKLMEVDDGAKGIIYPYCKGCKKNIPIDLPLKRKDALHTSA
nr:MAG TPA: cysteine-rich protein [Caudoviricetes sp.]